VPTTTAAWAASRIGSTYYRSTCSAARRLSAKNLIYFKSEEEAQKAGYHRSTSRGC
jgi:methylphosphotriester-DNA--protein-cysteine methyltransferase